MIPTLQFLPCRQCRLLRAQLLRCERESEERATADEKTCREIYEHMERLAQLNMVLVQQRKQAPGQASQVIVLEEYDHGRVDSKASSCLDERIQRLQVTVVQQAKVIERLRRQLKSMVPTLPLDGATRTTAYDSDDASSDTADGEDTEDGVRASTVERGLQRLPLTSLHAQLKSRDAEIRRLEQHAAQLAQELDLSREKKHRAAQQYQQITKSQQTELKKYTASLQAQQRKQQSLERRVQELNEYVEVLERKLLVVSRPTRSS